MLELHMEECLNQRDPVALVSLLREEDLSTTLVTSLDKMVSKELYQAGFNNASVVLKAIGNISEGREDLELLLKHGLGVKMVLWFEAIRDLLTSDLYKNSSPLLSLTKEFYNYFLLLGEASCQVSAHLLSAVQLQLARLVLECGITFGLRLEAIQTYNSILQSSSTKQRRLLQLDTHHCQILDQLATAILTVGDYELQASLSEALCRLTPRKDRKQRASHWFPSWDITNAFCSIQDQKFDVDCRHFLNCVNSYHEDTRVYTFPCLRAFLETTELFCPKDDKLDQFWIDFNLGSASVSFFINDPQGYLWRSVHLPRQEVDRYSFRCNQNECNEEETILSVHLISPIIHLDTEGQTVEMSFSSKQHNQLVEATCKVFTPAGLMQSATILKQGSSPASSSSSHSEVKNVVSRPESLMIEKNYPLETIAHTEKTKDYFSQWEKEGDAVHTSLCVGNRSCRSYFRKKPKTKSRLKILPVSSPSSGEDFSISKPSVVRTSEKDGAEFLFEQLKKSTTKPQLNSSQKSYLESGFCEGLQLFEEEDSDQDADAEAASSSAEQETFIAERKRTAPMTELAEGVSTEKKRARSPLEREGPHTALQGSETPASVAETGGDSEAELSDDITAALKTFKSKLQDNFTCHWEKAEVEVLQSFRECEQHISSVFRAVHHHRMLLLQSFENRVINHLSQLEENFRHLSNIQQQVKKYLQSEVQSLGSFVKKQQLRLESLEDRTEKEQIRQTTLFPE